jgi:hypothetical protein
MKKVWVFTVEGNGQFPFDMLRYDACYPAKSADVIAVHPSGRRDGKIMETRQATLKSLSGPPTVDRWKSYGWIVTEERQEKTA